MHISNFSVASLFSEMQSLFGASSGGAFSLGATAGQNMPSSPAASATSSVSTTPPAASTPASQFASDLLSKLLESQTSWSQAAAGDIINTINPDGKSLDLSQVEQALTGSTATTSPQQMAIANAFSQLTAGTGQLTQSQIALSLESMGSSMNGVGGMHHHRHHHFSMLGMGDSSGADGSTSSVSASALA
jgi:hypothetical protein